MDGKSNSYVYWKTVISSQLRNNAWYRDSHGLFDYNASWYSESEIYVEGSWFLNRDINDWIQLSEYNLDIEFDDTYRSEYEHSKTLASLAEIGGDYYLFHKASKIISNREKIWWVIKSFKTNKHGFRGHLLQKADKIRFGRLVYYVRDISSDPSNERDRENYDKNLINETKYEGDNIQEIMNSLENSHNNSKLTITLIFLFIHSFIHSIF